MQTLRRLYIYLVTLVSLEVVLWGVIGLVRSALDGQSSGDNTDILAGALALLLVSTPVFALHWWLAQRAARSDLEERMDRVRAFFLYTVLLITLIPAVQNTLAALNRLFLDALGVEPFRGIIGGGQTLGENLVAVLFNLLAVAYFYWVTSSDWKILTDADKDQQAALFYTRPFRETRRIYRYIWLIYGLGMFVFGIQQVLAAALTIWDTRDLIPQENLANGLTLLVVGFPLWLWGERLIRRSLFEPTEKDSFLRLFVLYGLVFIGLVVTLTFAGFVLSLILQSLLGMNPWADFLYDAAVPLSFLVPFALVWVYYWRELRTAIDGVSEGTLSQRQKGLRRLYTYFVALAGFVATFLGLATLLTGLISLASQQTAWSQPETRGDFATGLSLLAVGLPVWLWAWRPMVGEAAKEGELGDHARRSLIRRGYLYLILFASMLGFMFSMGVFIIDVLQTLLGNPPAELAQSLLQEGSLALLFGIVLGYHAWVLRSDNRQAARSFARRYAQFPVLILAPGRDEAEPGANHSGFEHEIIAALQRQMPGLPIAVHPYSLGVPDESLSSAQAIILPADLVSRPSEAFRLWLQAYSGSRLVIPAPSNGWYWIGQEGKSMPALARQVAQTIRDLAEGEQPASSRETSPWMIVGYIAAGLVGFLLLFLLFTGVVSFFLS